MAISWFTKKLHSAYVLTKGRLARNVWIEHLHDLQNVFTLTDSYQIYTNHLYLQFLSQIRKWNTFGVKSLFLMENCQFENSCSCVLSQIHSFMDSHEIGFKISNYFNSNFDKYHGRLTDLYIFLNYLASIHVHFWKPQNKLKPVTWIDFKTF